MKGKKPGLINIDVADDDVPPVDYPKPYEVQCHIDVPVSEDEVCEVTFNAVVDKGSPINVSPFLIIILYLK